MSDKRKEISVSDKRKTNALSYLDEANRKKPQLLSEYIRSFQCKCLQNPYCTCVGGRLKVLFEGVDGFVALLCVWNGYDGDPIQLHVEHDDRPWADAIYHKIYFSTGMINHFLELKALPQKKLLGYELPRNDIFDNILGIGASAWTISHECSHIFYHINDDFSAKLTSQAVEADADMLAAANVYRILQMFMVSMNDEDVRCLTLYCIFSIIRSLPHDAGWGGHPSTAMRLWFIFTKLATVRKNPKDPPDIYFLTRESKSAAHRLLTCLINCENEYQSLIPGEKTNLLPELKEIIEKETFSPISEQWDEMQDEIRKRVSERKAEH
ncbi:MAG: hypothetical protein EOO52_17750 [Gammaproteobacteria bacterium]|nr:MAG: hypothetical protein EOO52_17750 [Gammaproteobacteria bacterium]